MLSLLIPPGVIVGVTIQHLFLWTTIFFRNPVVAAFNNIVILTGAVLSAESGLGTFRGPGGLWENFRIEDVATPEAFARDPVRVHDFYNLRRSWHTAVKPNAAHL